MFDVIDRKTGKKLTVYSIQGDEFLVAAEQGFLFRDITDFTPATVAGSPVVQSTPCVFSAVHTENDELDALLNRMQSGELPVKLGDMISFKLLDGTDIDMVVTDQDDSTIRLESRDCLEINTSARQLDSYLDRIENLMPDTLLDRVIVRERPHVDAEGKRYTERRRLFVPAAPEIFPPDECYGDEGLYQQMEWYKDVRNRVRKQGRGGDTHWYWTGSPAGSNATNFCFVGSNGNANGNTASVANGCAPFGCIISKV